MKLREIKLVEGQVDITTLMVIDAIAKNGITDGAQTLTLARAVMALEQGDIMCIRNFNAYYDQFFPKKDLIDSLKALSKGEAQKLGAYVLSMLKAKDTQLALVLPFDNYAQVLYNASQSEASDS